jgi:hypothetical protein
MQEKTMRIAGPVSIDVARLFGTQFGAVLQKFTEVYALRNAAERDEACVWCVKTHIHTYQNAQDVFTYQ